MSEQLDKKSSYKSYPKMLIIGKNLFEITTKPVYDTLLS